MALTTKGGQGNEKLSISNNPTPEQVQELVSQVLALLKGKTVNQCRLVLDNVTNELNNVAVIALT